VTVIGPGELRTIIASYRRTAGFDVDELNARPSWSVGPVRQSTSV
jgi:hypothetical protein